MKFKHFITATVIAVVVTLFMALPFTNRLEAVSIDSLFWLRHILQQNFPDSHTVAAESKVIVIAVDEETYEKEPFIGLGKVFWTPQYAAVLNDVIDGGAKVVGFDIILPTSVEQHVPGYDREFLRTLYKHGRAGKIVLGKIDHRGVPVTPYRGHSFAVGNAKNIRLLNVGGTEKSDDDVIRYMPLWAKQVEDNGNTRTDPFMSLELAARSIDEKVSPNDGESFTFNNQLIPTTANNEILINFNTQPNYIPTYSLADLYTCSQKDNNEYFKKHFDDKIVLVGAVLDTEDRRQTSMRYAQTRGGLSVPERCVISYDATRYAETATRDQMPGVYVHAQAINNLLFGNSLKELSNLNYALLTLPLVLIIAIVSMLIPPVRMTLVALLLGGVWIAIVINAFYSGLVLPLFNPLVGMAICFAAVLGLRFNVTDKDKRLYKKSFEYYLEPAVIDDMIESGNLPALGGEKRTLTVWFSDIADYTSISESLSPSDLVEFLNQYFDEMTSIVKQYGGFVDKYVGDAIIAVFGAPHDDPNHALHAVQSAIKCNQRLHELRLSFGLPGDTEVAARIGINTGEMLVGNIGSSHRLNYTIMGDAVNLASRLEGVNKVYGTKVIASDTTVLECGDKLTFRELDMVRVKGRESPVTIYEPLSNDDPMPISAKHAENFASGLAAYRARKFDHAIEVFTILASQGDVAAEKFAVRAQHYANSPPPDNWDEVNTLDTK